MKKRKVGTGRLILFLLAGIAILAFTPVRDKYFEITKSIELFANAYKQLNAKYVDEIDPEDLMKRGMDAMTKSLDPFTRYISETDIENYRLEIDGKYDGIGATVRKIGDYITITGMYEQSPAKKAGLKVGDQILSIEGKDLKGKKTGEVTRIMRGAPKTKVNVKVRNIGSDIVREIEVTRGEVHIPNVPYSGIVRDSIGYISLTTFTQDAGRNVAKALKKMEAKQELKGVILDLRDNGGGLLREAVNVVNVFNPGQQLVVFTKGRLPDSRREYFTLHGATDDSIPLVVLVNAHSASASEIVSGVTQDLDRGVIMGQRSYGKGLVQNTFDIGYNSKIKLTTAKYYTPSGRCIQSAFYDHGEKKDLPDSLRTLFKTHNGRPVYGGGAVTPDIKLPKPVHASIVGNLRRNHMFFRYVSAHMEELATKCDSSGCSDDVYDAFIRFLKEEDYHFDGPTQKTLSELKKNAEKDGLLSYIATQIQALEQKIRGEQWNLLDASKDEVIHLIEQDFVGRKFYIKGVKRLRLSDDPEVDAAIALLKDKKKYMALLNP